MLSDCGARGRFTINGAHVSVRFIVYGFLIEEDSRVEAFLAVVTALTRSMHNCPLVQQGHVYSKNNMWYVCHSICSRVYVGWGVHTLTHIHTETVRGGREGERYSKQIVASDTAKK